MRLASRYWADSAIAPSLSESLAGCLIERVRSRSELAETALEVLPLLPGEPGREVALSLAKDEGAPVPLRGRAVRTLILRTTPLPQDDLVALLKSTPHEELYNAAAYALRRSDDSSVVPALVQAANRFWNPAVRLTLEARIDLVRQAATSHDPAIREAGLYALRRLDFSREDPSRTKEPK
jgi:hypothetical protein